ncbi:MAG: MotA/TolQ/ExbB proton channel family protein [Planctomycetota bacterium]|nr:MAG: MotA/TolQ/ExbB proton channel family protein [Planctomycetota bacterium]
MVKSFWLKTFVLVVALVAVLGVIILTMRLDSGGPVMTMQGQTFFTQFVIGGGPIVWFVLLPMSVVMVFFATEHSLTIRRKRLLPCGIGSEVVELVKQFGPERLEEQIGDKGDLVSVAVLKAVAGCRGDRLRMRSTLEESLQEQAWGLMRRIEWLSLIGTISPMVGLFGTVFGMIKLFNAIVAAGGQPQPAQLADGISVALVTTFWGLFIAIPAVAMHGVFRNRIETLVSDAVTEAENIVPEIRCSLNQKEFQGREQKQRIQELPAKPARAVGDSVRTR